MSSREQVMGRIRAALGEATGDPQRSARMEAHLAGRARGPVPAGDWPGSAAGVVERFVERAQALASTVERVAGMEAAPAAVARYLAAQGLAAQAVAWPAVAALAWADAGIEVDARPAVGTDLVGITSCFCGVADTGTLLLLSGADTPAALSLVTETHIALVPARRIVPFMEDAWALVRAERGEPPRAANFVSGPSRTTDIEQTLTFGVHGPYRVHIVLVG